MLRFALHISNQAAALAFDIIALVAKRRRDIREYSLLAALHRTTLCQAIFAPQHL
jgi:hypothetical protein